MRIISGIYKGTNLFMPKDVDIRPALARMKNSLFNILMGRFEGKSVLDMFAGTGSLGFEALSRGAKYCLFLENHHACIDAIQQTIAKLKLERQSKVTLMDSFNVIAYALRENERFDYIFIDPPYKYYDEKPMREKLLGIINEMAEKNIINKNGLIIAEHRGNKTDETDFNNLACLERIDLRNYGQTSLSFLRPKKRISL